METPITISNVESSRSNRHIGASRYHDFISIDTLNARNSDGPAFDIDAT